MTDPAVRYDKLGRVALNVTDLERSRAFYVDLVGLQDVGLGPDGEVRLRCCEDHHSVTLHRSDVAGVRSSGWRLEGEAQFDNLYRRLARAGTPWTEWSEEQCAAHGLARACGMIEPITGARLEFYTERPGERPWRFKATLANIQRLGHVVYCAAKQAEAVTYFRDVLGFVESDSVDSWMTFMRCFPSPFHHGLGLGKDDANHFHHLNFMVSEIDDVGRALTRFRKEGVQIVYGAGRHPISGSIFLYFLDPDGLTLEYSFGMEEFSEEGARAPRLLPRKREWSDSWGSTPDPRFGKTGTLG